MKIFYWTDYGLSAECLNTPNIPGIALTNRKLIKRIFLFIVCLAALKRGLTSNIRTCCTVSLKFQFFYNRLCVFDLVLDRNIQLCFRVLFAFVSPVFVWPWSVTHSWLPMRQVPEPQDMFCSSCPQVKGITDTTLVPNSKHWFTTSFFQPLPYLVTP